MSFWRINLKKEDYAAFGNPTTCVLEPLAWATPIVRSDAPIIGLLWLTTINWAFDDWLVINFDNL